MRSLRIIDVVARIAWVLVLVWQVIAVAALLVSLADDTDPAMQFGAETAIYSVAAIVVVVLVSVVLLLPYGGELTRRLGVWARVLGWQAAVGSVLVFSIALTSDDLDETDVAGVAGLFLLAPAVIGALFWLLADARAHRVTAARLADQDRRLDEALAELRQATARLEASTARLARPWWRRIGR